MRIIFLLCFGLLLAGCQSRYVTCRSEYLYPEYLASTNVNTPDPLKECYYGQQVIVRWKLPRTCLANGPISLRLQLRYGNREIETLIAPIEKRHGWKIHRLVNRDYWCRGGILAFKAELIQNDQVLGDWTHYLWADLINITDV